VARGTDGAPRRHQLPNQGGAISFGQCRIRSAPQAIANDEVPAIRRYWEFVHVPVRTRFSVVHLTPWLSCEGIH
jgi:hypothetical protein